jgi:tetratricopeptide (TPR) repeat protein
MTTPGFVSTVAAPLAERVQALQQTLEHACRAHAQQPVAGDVRDQLKQDIIALFREADAALQQAQATKDAVKALADQWKQLDGRGGATVSSGDQRIRPTPSATTSVGATASRAHTGRIDHLGASTFIEKGWSKLSLLDAAGAEVAFHRALELAPGSVEAETLLSWAQMMQDDLDGAMETLHHVFARDPHSALAHANVGYICLRKKIYGEAIEHLSTVIRDDSDRRAVLYAHLYLGMVYCEREMFDDAEAFFRKALELGPNLLQAWYELGRTFWFAGRHADALQAWKTGSEANKFSPWGKRCAEMLVEAEQGRMLQRNG